MKLDAILTGKRVAVYGRHSTDKQDMDAQLSSAQRLIDEYGCIEVCKYLDRGVSATRAKRENRRSLVQLLSDADAGKFDVVISYNRDRLARNPIEHMQIRSILKELQIPIVLSSNQTLYDTGDLVSQLAFDGLTKFEVDQTRIRTRDALRHFVEKGRWTGGKTPYGYTYHEASRVFSPHPECKGTIEKIFKLYRQGEGFKHIAKLLSDETGRNWNKETIKSIITNPFYAGFVTFGKGLAKSHASIAPREYWLMNKCKKITPIIDESDWEACWKIYWDKREGITSPTEQNTPFLLKGRIYCDTCGALMEATNQTSRSNTGKKYGERWYRCPNFKTCGTRVAVDDVHQNVTDALQDLVLSRTDIYPEVAKRLHADALKLHNRIKELREENQETEREAFEAQAMVKQIGKETNLDERQKIIVSQIQRYRLEMGAKQRRIEAEIVSCETKVRDIEEVQIRPDLWNEVRVDVLKSPTNSAAIRRLILYLVDQVIVNDTGKIVKLATKAD